MTDGTVLTGNCLSESDSDRADGIEFGRNPGDEGICDWGTFVVSVSDKHWSTIMPSRLYRFVHGTADPDNRATLKCPRYASLVKK